MIILKMFRSFISSEAPQLLRQTHTDFSDFDPAPPNPNPNPVTPTPNPTPVTPTPNPTPVTPTPTHAPAICPNVPIGAAALACGLPTSPSGATSPSGDLVPQNLFGGSSEDDTDSESDDSESDTESDGSESDGSDGATDVDLSSEDEDG